MKQAATLTGKLVRAGMLVFCILLIFTTVQGARAEDKRFTEPTIKVYDYYESDEPVQISSSWPEGADSLTIFVLDEEGNDAIPGCIWDRQNSGMEFYTFEVNVMDRRLDPGSYTAVVEVRGEGYRTRRYKRPFLILPDGMTLDDYEASLPSNTQSTPVPDIQVPDIGTVEGKPESSDPPVPPAQAAATVTQVPTATPSPVPTAVPTEAPKIQTTGNGLVFKQGSKLVLFDRDGMRLTLTGSVEDKGSMGIGLAAQFENHTGEDLNLVADGSVNGSSARRMIVSKSNTEAGKTSDCVIRINYNDFDLTGYNDIRQLELSFTVQKIEIETTSSSNSSSSSSSSGNAKVSSSSSASASASTISVKGVYKTIAPVMIQFADYEENRGLRYFEEQPLLPHPFNYLSVKVVRSSTSSSNGKITSAIYGFEPKDKGNKTADLVKTYINELRKLGLTVAEAGGEYVISSNGVPIAKITTDNKTFTITLIVTGGK